MSKTQKFFIICGTLTAAGIFIAFMGFIMGGLVTRMSFTENGMQLDTPMRKNERSSYQKQKAELEAFTDLDLEVASADIRIIPSDHYGIEWRMREDDEFDYKVEDGCLYVTQKYLKSSYSISVFDWSFFSESSESRYVNLYVPKDASLKTMDISCESGDAEFSDLLAESFELNNKYGNVTIDNIECKDISLVLDSGNLDMENTKCSTIAIDDRYGNVELDGLDGKDISLVLDSGNLDMNNAKGSTLAVDAKYGDLKLDKVEMTEQTDLAVDSGDVDLTNTKLGELEIMAQYGNIEGRGVTAGATVMQLDSGNCSIKDFGVDKIDTYAKYGNVKLELRDKTEAFIYELDTQYGDITINNEEMGEKYNSQEENSEKQLIKIECDSGDIEIKGSK